MQLGPLVFHSEPVYLAIVNVTPDSFSDGGRYFDSGFDPSLAVDAVLRFEDEGAEAVDLGAESTRPGAEAVSADTERRRLEPVLERLDGRVQITLSVDTYKPVMAQSALERGVKIINDITGGTDPQMRAVFSRFKPVVILGHHLPGYMGGCIPVKPAGEEVFEPAVPAPMPKTLYKDVVEEVYQELARRRDEVIANGLPKENISLDPGIGFGKTYTDNMVLLDHMEALTELGCPLTVGVSRKRFLNAATLAEADYKTREWGKRLVDCGVQILRVHTLPKRQD